MKCLVLELMESTFILKLYESSVDKSWANIMWANNYWFFMFGLTNEMKTWFSCLVSYMKWKHARSIFCSLPYRTCQNAATIHYKYLLSLSHLLYGNVSQWVPPTPPCSLPFFFFINTLAIEESLLRKKKITSIIVFLYLILYLFALHLGSHL